MRSLSAPFRIDSTGRAQSTDDVTQIVEHQITNILVTAQFERVMRPYYGSSVQALLFEPVDSNVFADQEADITGRLNDSLRLAQVRAVRLKTDFGSPAMGEATRTTLVVEVSYFIPPADQALRILTIPFSTILTEES